MASITLACASIGTFDAWTLSAGATKVIAVALPDDDATTRIAEGTQNDSQSFNLDNAPGDAATVDQVDATWRHSKSGASDCSARPFLYLSGSQTNGTTTNPTNGVYNTTTSSALARPGGGSWTVADINSTELGVQRTAAAGGDSVICTTLYATLTYSPAAGGFAYLIASWLPPLIAAASHGLSFADLKAILQNLKTRPSSGEEFRRLLEAFRRRPRFAF